MLDAWHLSSWDDFSSKKDQAPIIALPWLLAEPQVEYVQSFQAKPPVPLACAFFLAQASVLVSRFGAQQQLPSGGAGRRSYVLYSNFGSFTAQRRQNINRSGDFWKPARSNMFKARREAWSTDSGYIRPEKR